MGNCCFLSVIFFLRDTVLWMNFSVCIVDRPIGEETGASVEVAC